MAKYKDIGGTTVGFRSGAEEYTYPSGFEGSIYYNSGNGQFEFVGLGTGTWASGTSFNTGRTAHGSTGNTSNALIFGGSPPYTGITELWNGSSWTEVADLNHARAGAATAGADHTSALYASGANPPGAYKSDVEVWDGSSWSEVSEINQARYFASGIGTATAALFAGGNRPPTSSPGAQVTVESWDGSSWTEIADLNTARYGSGESGSQTSAIVFGGTPVVVSNELWNGSSWTEVGNLNTGRAGAGSSSTTSTSALAFGGEAPDYTAATESWDGSSWTELSDLSAAKANTGGSGTAINAIATGGDPVSANTEEWAFSHAIKTVTTS